MKEIERDEVWQEICDFDLPLFREIPNIGLFLDQTQKYVAQYTDLLGSVVLTGSMISNYVKHKILDNPIKKQYYREQIAYLFFISIAKTVLSMEDIQLLLELQKEKCSCEQAYEYFRKELKQTLNHIVLGEDRVITGEEESTEREKVLLKSTVLTVAHKIYLDQYFKALR